MAWTLSRVRASGEGYLREMGRARMAQLTGRPGVTAREIRAAYRHDLGRGAIDIALEQSEVGGGEGEARSGQALVAWLAELEVQEACATIDESLADWWARAVVRTADARVVPVAAAGREIAREGDRAMRLQLDTARVALLERDVVPLLAERAARERDAIERLGIAGSLREVAERLTGEDSAALAKAARDAISQSADAWRDSLGEQLRREASLSRDEARPADVAHVLDASLFDAAFRASDRESLARRTVVEMGFDPGIQERLHYPLARLRGSRAQCVPEEVPLAVNLVFGDSGGVLGHRHGLEALGAALRFASVEGDAPFERRWLGDAAIMEMCGRVLSAVTLDETWLMRHAGLSRNEARRLLRVTTLAAMYEARHACALQIAYVEAVDASLSVGAQEELYAETIGSAIGVRPHGVDAFMDALPVLRPGARLRGMQGASVLLDELVERFDVDWYRNPRVGPFLTQAVLAPTAGESADEMVSAATGRPPSLVPWLARLERMLAA